MSGLTTEATFGALATSAAASLTAVAYLASVSLPLWACSTIGLVPFAWSGNDLASVSVARWLSVPGSDRLSLVLSPRRWETATSAIVATSQMPSTTNRRRTQNCASPYSTPVIVRQGPLSDCRLTVRASSPGRWQDCQAARAPGIPVL